MLTKKPKKRERGFITTSLLFYGFVSLSLAAHSKWASLIHALI